MSRAVFRAEIRRRAPGEAPNRRRRALSRVEEPSTSLEHRDLARPCRRSAHWAVSWQLNHFLCRSKDDYDKIALTYLSYALALHQLMLDGLQLLVCLSFSHLACRSLCNCPGQGIGACCPDICGVFSEVRVPQGHLCETWLHAVSFSASGRAINSICGLCFGHVNPFKEGLS